MTSPIAIIARRLGCTPDEVRQRLTCAQIAELLAYIALEAEERR